MRVAIYARVSTEKDQNPELQIHELKAYCVSRGWSLEREIIDRGYSGGTTAASRPGLRELMALARSRSIDAVVVLKLDRLFRSLKDLLITLEELSALGITFVAVRDQVDYSTAAGRLFVSVLGSLAEFERALIRERTILGLEHARRRGKRLGRPRKHKTDEILRLRATGSSYRQIQRELGVPMGVISRALVAAPKSPSKEHELILKKPRS